MKFAPLAAFFAAFVCLPAAAADPAFDAFMGRVVGNQTTVTFGSGGTPMATSSAHLGTPAVGNMHIGSSGSSMLMQGRSQMPIPGTARTLPIDVKVPMSGRNFAKALTAAGRIAWPIGVIITSGEIFDYLNSEGFVDIKNTPNGIIARKLNQYYGFEYALPDVNIWYSSPLDACKKFFTPVPQPDGTGYLSANYSINTTGSGANAEHQCVIGVTYKPNTYTDSFYLPGRFTTPIRKKSTTGGNISDPISQAEIEDKIASNSGWPTSAARALASALATPGVTPKFDNPTVTGPATLPGEKTTTSETVKLIPGTTTIAAPGTTTPTQPGTKTTVKQEAAKATYAGNTVTTNTSVTNTTVTITNNVTNETTVEGDKIEETENKDPPKEKEETITCGLPDTPKCQIDELDTPAPKEDTAKDDVEAKAKPLDDFIKNPEAVLPQLPTINWAFQLPSGCAPIALPAFDPWLQEIDVCSFQPLFHDVMSFVWIIGGLFGAISIFWRNTFAQG